MYRQLKRHLRRHVNVIPVSKGISLLGAVRLYISFLAPKSWTRQKSSVVPPGAWLVRSNGRLGIDEGSRLDLGREADHFASCRWKDVFPSSEA